MMRLCLTNKGMNVLSCPLCDRELIPAYMTEEGLEVGYWYDFDPPEGTAGLLVCGDFRCEYEEDVIFTKEAVDAVPLCLSDTLTAFEDANWTMGPVADAREMAQELREAYKATGRAKLRQAVEYYEQAYEEHQEHIEKWLVEAADRYPVNFRFEEEEIEGMVTGHDAETFAIRTEDGRELTFRKDAIFWERIIYPRKEHKPGRNPGMFIVCRNHLRIVVQGYHLEYQHENELGLHVGGSRDPAIAAALNLQQKYPNYWEGLFHTEEIERHYLLRAMVKIQGHWLKEIGRDSDENWVCVSTEDPDVAQALDLHPHYAMDCNEFGCRDGEIVHYSDAFPVAEIEEIAWYEQIMPLPSEMVEE